MSTIRASGDATGAPNTEHLLEPRFSFRALAQAQAQAGNCARGRRAAGWPPNDAGCIIPGCTRPPQYTQAHHVIPWNQGGPTNIDNAVLLCNAAHTSINTSGRDIDMRNGRPWIRGPLLLDPTQTWRPARQNRATTPTEQPNWNK